MIVDAKILGARLNKIRKDRGISSDKLAELVDISPTHIRQIERGDRLPSLQVFVALVNTLGVPPSVLLLESLNKVDDSALNDFAKRMQNIEPKKFCVIERTLDSLLDSLKEF